MQAYIYIAVLGRVYDPMIQLNFVICLNENAGWFCECLGQHRCRRQPCQHTLALFIFGIHYGSRELSSLANQLQRSQLWVCYSRSWMRTITYI